MKDSGCCLCLDCKPKKIDKRGVWILKEVNHEYFYTKIVVCCREYYEYSMKKIYIGQFHEHKMNVICMKKRCYYNFIGTKPCCYNFFITGLQSVKDFCSSDLCDFQLKKVKLVE